MYNWEYGVSKKDANGKPIQDEIKRKHPSLTDYSKLTNKEKKKDIDAIKSSKYVDLN